MRKFKKIYIETTNVCNLSCNFCPKTQREYKFMDKAEFKIIIDKIKGYTNYIYLHLMGEPFLNENLEEFLKIAKDANIKVNITSNGTLINNVKEILIKDNYIRQINLSLHSFEANDNNIDFNEYIKSLLEFINEANKKTNIICSLRLWNMDTEELKADNSLNSKILKLIEDILELDLNLREELNIKTQLKLKDRIYLNMAEKFSWPDSNIELISDNVFCYGLRDHVGILVDGTVVPCCLDSDGNIPLGNIFNENFGDIIESERAFKIYEGFSNRKAVEDLCKRCGYATRKF